LVAPENSKYTQQHAIDVGDAPGHQVRIYELHRTFPGNAPVVNGLKLTKSWRRAVTDYIDGNGSSTTSQGSQGSKGAKGEVRAAIDVPPQASEQVPLEFLADLNDQ
jgi:hypothetical protein